MQKLEGRVSSDEDLKLSDLLRYYERDSQAALVCVTFDIHFVMSYSFFLKDLLYRRMRSLANLEASNKSLDKARTKNKGVIEVWLHYS